MYKWFVITVALFFTAAVFGVPSNVSVTTTDNGDCDIDDFYPFKDNYDSSPPADCPPGP